MYFAIGKHECLRVLMLLGSLHGGTPSNLKELKEHYLSFIRHISDSNVCTDTENDQFCTDDVRIAALVNRFTSSSLLTDIETHTVKTPGYARNAAKQKILEGKELLMAQCAGLLEIFDIVIHTLFYERSMEAGGGSVSSAPGVIWCSVRRNWSEQDAAEFLVHELTHNLLFLHERATRHYTDFTLIAQERNFAKSAVLRRQRPLDKVFHSLLVAHEILQYRLVSVEPSLPKVHPPSKDLVMACVDTINSIKNIYCLDALVTPAFMDLFAIVSDKIDTIRYQVECLPISSY